MGEHLNRLLLQSCAMGSVILHSFDFPYATQPGPFPIANPVARIAARTTHLLPNLCHRVVAIEDPMSRALVQLVDGSRDRETLTRIVARMVAGESGEITPEMLDTIAADLDRNLRLMAHRALLVA
jgi:hypothetical protein